MSICIYLKYVERKKRNNAVTKRINVISGYSTRICHACHDDILICDKSFKPI